MSSARRDLGKTANKMGDEAKPQNFQSSEFRDVQLGEMPSQQPESHIGIPIAQPIYQAGNIGYSPQPIYAAQQVPSLSIQVEAKQEREKERGLLLRYQKFLKWLSIADIVSILFFMVGLFFPLLILLPFPLLGFFASRRLSKCLTVCYLVWLCLLMVVRLVLLFVTRSIAFAVINFLLIIFDIWVIVITVKFLRQLGKVYEQDLEDLRNGIVEQRQPQLDQPQNELPQFAPDLQSQQPPLSQPQVYQHQTYQPQQYQPQQYQPQQYQPQQYQPQQYQPQQYQPQPKLASGESKV